MAGGMDLGTGGKGGKKPLDTAINLVPFIDLMACTIAFLIMTAVWTNIGRLQVASSGGGADAVEKTEELMPITIHLAEHEVTLRVGPTTLEHLKLTDLASHLRDAKKAEPSQQEVTVEAEDTVKYDDLVRTIDTCVGEGLPNVSVSPANT